jgi:hypothetical protein
MYNFDANDEGWSFHMEEIRIPSYNPYASLYPDLKVVSRETVHLIKLLREEGYNVIVEPAQIKKLNYYVEKGLREILADPILLYVIGISTSILTGLISARLYDIWRKPPEKNETQLIIEFDEDGNKVRYSQSGENVSDEKFASILRSLDERAAAYKNSRENSSPLPNRLYPVYLEHSSKIVGWAENVVTKSGGLYLEGLQITDPEVQKLVENGYLTGVSVAGIVKKSTCSVCNSDFIECNHIPKKVYNGKECLVRIDDFAIAEFSLVKDPIHPMARIARKPRDAG